MSRDELVAEILRMQHALMRASMRHHSRTMVDEGLTPVQFHLLLFLHGREAVPTAEAAEALALKPNIATGVVQRVVDRGWVCRHASPDDGRVRLLSLTEEGVALVNETVEEAERGFVSHLDALSDEQIAQFAAIMETILAAGAAKD